jgi:NTP pyrophosphatase (non-canonical NTP hydrolase)
MSYLEEQLARTRMSDGHHLSREQIARHGRDRYPTVEKQLKKLGEELIELALAIGHAPRSALGEPDPEVRHEYADVGLAYHALGDKLRLDAIECMNELVENDTRDFRD